MEIKFSTIESPFASHRHSLLIAIRFSAIYTNEFVVFENAAKMPALLLYNGRMSTGNQFEGNRQFATTQWSIVRAIGEENPAAANYALQELCQKYWYPPYTYVRGQDKDASAAADLTQAFFADLLQRDDLKKAAPSLGKFRSFLLSALKHFLMNQWDKAEAQKRGGND